MDRSETLISVSEVVKLYDTSGKEIGMTVGGTKEIAHAMAVSQRIDKAVIHSEVFGQETVTRKDIADKIEKYRDNKRLGDNLLFWVGEPIVINR